MASPVILDLRSSVSIVLDDPHQFHADPRLDMHLSPPRRILARVAYPVCARLPSAALVAVPVGRSQRPGSLSKARATAVRQLMGEHPHGWDRLMEECLE